MGLTLTWCLLLTGTHVVRKRPLGSPPLGAPSPPPPRSKAEGTWACGVPTPCGGRSTTARALRFNSIARLPGLESFELRYLSLPCSPHL